MLEKVNQTIAESGKYVLLNGGAYVTINPGYGYNIVCANKSLLMEILTMLGCNWMDTKNITTSITCNVDDVLVIINKNKERSLDFPSYQSTIDMLNVSIAELKHTIKYLQPYDYRYKELISESLNILKSNKSMLKFYLEHGR